MTCGLAGIALGLLLLDTSAFSQKATFEVASVKPSTSNAFPTGGGGPGTPDPGQVQYHDYPMAMLLRQAFDVDNFRLSGPSWIESERYSVDAKVPLAATKEQFREMLQNLLSERFGLMVHHENRSVSGYVLIPAKNGPKLKEPEVGAADLPRGKMVQTDKNGVKELRPGAHAFAMFTIPGGSRMSARDQDLSGMLRNLQFMLKSPVIDETGLKGQYDFNLTYSPPSPSARPQTNDGIERAPDLFGALQEQLGLKLESKKVQLDVIVVDHLERVPSEN